MLLLRIMGSRETHPCVEKVVWDMRWSGVTSVLCSKCSKYKQRMAPASSIAATGNRKKTGCPAYASHPSLPQTGVELQHPSLQAGAFLTIKTQLSLKHVNGLEEPRNCSLASQPAREQPWETFMHFVLSSSLLTKTPLLTRLGNPGLLESCSTPMYCCVSLCYVILYCCKLVCVVLSCVALYFAVLYHISYHCLVKYSLLQYSTSCSSLFRLCYVILCYVTFHTAY